MEVSVFLVLRNICFTIWLREFNCNWATLSVWELPSSYRVGKQTSWPYFSFPRSFFSPTSSFPCLYKFPPFCMLLCLVIFWCDLHLSSLFASETWWAWSILHFMLSEQGHLNCRPHALSKSSPNKHGKQPKRGHCTLIAFLVRCFHAQNRTSLCWKRLLPRFEPW